MEFEEIKEINEQEPQPIQQPSDDAKVQIPDWDLVPPFDSVDRSEM